ncbi:MAG: type III secretion system inner membrane ring subunit SctD, partial [Chlamydiia bacterium]|nr:type III secretion system inner membrane ring subunit SctD [Chlamydiia bacterium]
IPERDRLAELNTIIHEFSGIRFTYNQLTGKLFLMGHLQTGIEHNELMHQLRGLSFLTGIENNTVNDEAVWQEMNILLSKHPEFKGVSMHAPEPGLFVISGYLQTEQQASDLTDYLNVNFNYLTCLQNRVIVEQALLEEVATRLLQQKFTSVSVSVINGELQLTGYISSTDLYAFEQLLEELKTLPGVRSVRNFVVSVTPEQNVIDLNKGQQIGTLVRYHVTGYSKHGEVNLNVVINGKILGRGNCIDGYVITSIQPHTIFLEKEGLQYKIEYNKCKSISEEE